MYTWSRREIRHVPANVTSAPPFPAWFLSQNFPGLVCLPPRPQVSPTLHGDGHLGGEHGRALHRDAHGAGALVAPAIAGARLGHRVVGAGVEVAHGLAIVVVVKFVDDLVVPAAAAHDQRLALEHRSIGYLQDQPVYDSQHKQTPRESPALGLPYFSASLLPRPPPFSSPTPSPLTGHPRSLRTRSIRR